MIRYESEGKKDASVPSYSRANSILGRFPAGMLLQSVNGRGFPDNGDAFEPKVC